MDESYELAPRFERTVVWLICDDAKFYMSIGRHVDASMMGADIATILVEAAHAVFSKTGKPPASTVLLMQHLQDMNNEGQLESGALFEADSYFEGAEIDNVASDSVIASMLPKVQAATARTIKRDAIDADDPQAYTEIGKRYSRVSGMGQVDEGHGYIFTPNDYSNIDSLITGDRLGFGIAELEEITRGGLKRSKAGILVAPSGGGKTTGLCHIAGWAMSQGISVAYASLELPIGEIECKVRGGLTSCLLHKIETDLSVRRLCADRISEMTGLGGLAIKKFSARKTHWSHIVDWFEGLAESALGERPTLLMIDFLGKLGWADPRKTRYEAHGEYMDNMHDYAETENIWLWTASQPTRMKDKSKKKVIDNDDLNESQGKIEGADLFISMNPRDGGKEIYWWVGKHRDGPSQIGCGPFPQDFAHGRVVPPGFQASAPADDRPEVTQLFAKFS